MKCKKCGSTKITTKETRTPGNPLGGFRIIAWCENCLSILVPEPRTNPSPSVPKGRLWNFPKSTVGRVEIKETIPFAIHSAIVDALDHAKTKHPHFADSNAEAGTVIAEELLEVNTAALKVMQSINDQESRDNLFVELAQAIATEIRMMEKLLK